MIIEFTAGNFRSLREPVTLSLIATALDKNTPLSTENVIPVADDLSLLRSVVIYGANASGKSNLFKAFAFFRRFVLNSARESGAEDPIDVEPFLLRDDCRDQPSHFEVVFLNNGIQYRYGFEATRERVTSEWLFHTPTSREATLFVRDTDGIRIPSHSSFREGRALVKLTRDNALFLSVAAQFNGEIAQRLLKWFLQCASLSASTDERYMGYTTRCIEQGKYVSLMNQLMQDLDVGINKLSVLETPLSPAELPFFTTMMQAIKTRRGDDKEDKNTAPPTKKLVQTWHEVRDESGGIKRLEAFDMQEMESEGTKKIIALGGPLFDALSQGRVLFIDEIDARLHPLLTAAIIRLFNSPETNLYGAQLICATHDTNLLDGRRLRRDQICFTEKEDGATRLYSLADFKIDGNKRVRGNALFEQDYIQGRYGAIPYLGDLSRFFAEEVQEAETTNKTEERTTEAVAA